MVAKRKVQVVESPEPIQNRTHALKIRIDDLKTFQRIKETSNFEFPVEIDLNNYMEVSVFKCKKKF
jgi:hypothetical protein